MIRYGYLEEHEQYRRTVRAFLDRELEPHYKKYATQGGLDKGFWKKAGAAGILGAQIPEAYGGAGGDFTYSVILSEEIGRSIGSAATGSSLMADVAWAILIHAGNEDQKRRYLPGALTGEYCAAMPLTEPDAGSDATAIKTTAVKDGGDYVINGEKYFISNGTTADVLFVVAKTDPSKRGAGMSVILVPADTKGVSRAKIPLIGWPQGDTASFKFDNVRVPQKDIIGKEGEAMKIMMATFLEDRLQIAGRCLGAAELALRLTVDYVKQRKAFGQRIADFQNTQFVLAECKAEIDVCTAMLDMSMMQLREGKLSFSDGASIKLYATEMEGRVMDKCLQLHGGAGLMIDTPIALMYTAARVQRIYAGTSELQKVSIAKALLG